MRRCALVSALPWANRMPQRSRKPDAACGRGMALVTGPGMRYDAAAYAAIFQPFSADFGHFQPFFSRCRPPISATHDSLARFRPRGNHGSCPPVVPA
jgi:hypothetical protein